MGSHSERTHAKYSASSADRWLHCTGSTGLISKVNRRPPNKYADRGTALHTVAERMLTYGNDEEFKEGDLVPIRLGENYELTEGDIEGVKVYVEEVRSKFDGDGMMWVEHELAFHMIHPLVGGNVDAVVVAGDTLYVFDLKTGRGHVVSPEENPQALQYAIGAYLSLPDKARERVKKVSICIVQPFSSVAAAVRYWDTEPIRLIEQIAAIQNAVEEGESGGKLVPGEWCDYCPAAGTCPALHTMSTEVVEYMTQPPVSMSADEIGLLLWKWKHIEPLMEALLQQAQGLAEAGIQIPGFKLSGKRARYAWADEVQAQRIMYGAGLTPDQVFVKKMVTPAQAKKALGKKIYDERLLGVVTNTSVGYNLVLDDQYGRVKGPDLTPQLPSLAQLLPSPSKE